MVTKATEETLNAICPYSTMFPLNFPRELLAANARSGEWVLDPFCGRGTTNYAARLCGLNSIGIDSNPVAVAIAQAKLLSCTPNEIVEAAKRVLDEIVSPTDVPQGEFWGWAYHSEVLSHICRIREGLLADCTTKARMALRAIMLGALHGHVLKTTASYFSNQCQRTYSPKPDYAVKFWKTKSLKPPNVDVLAVIEKRAKRFYSCLPSTVDGFVLQGDSRNLSQFHDKLQNITTDWIITSPPYYGMKSYLPDQWLRLWFVGGKPRVNYDKSAQLRHTGVDMFAEELRQVWQNLRVFSSPNTKMVVRFGGLPSVKSNPLDLLKKSFEKTGWQVGEIRSAGFSSNGRRQAYLQAKNQNPPIEEFDVWVSLSETNSP